MISYTGPNDLLLPAYSFAGIVFDVSTTVNEANVKGLRIKAEVFYRGRAINPWVKIGTKRQEKYIGTNIYRFNVDGYLQSVLKSTIVFVLGHGTIRTNGQGDIIQFKVRFVEEYRDAAGLVQEYDAIETDIKYCINATRQIAETENINDVFTMRTGAFARFLTNRVKPIKWRPGERIQLSFIHNLPAATIVARMTVTHTTGSETFDIATGTAGNETLTRFILNLSGIFADNGLTASVHIANRVGSTYTRISEIINIVPDYSLWGDTTRLVWLNSLGGFDDYTFTGQRTTKNKVKREEYKRQAQNNIQSRGYTSLTTTSNDEVTIYSQFEGSAMIAYIMGVFDSPEVYLYQNGQYIAVNVENSGIEYAETNTIKQIKLTYTRAVEKLIQNG